MITQPKQKGKGKEFELSFWRLEETEVACLSRFYFALSAGANV